MKNKTLSIKEKYALDLIRFHYEKNEEEFKKTVNAIARELNSDGYIGIAEYVLAQDSEIFFSQI
jgi:hypothetical protein